MGKGEVVGVGGGRGGGVLRKTLGTLEPIYKLGD